MSIEEDKREAAPGSADPADAPASPDLPAASEPGQADSAAPAAEPEGPEPSAPDHQADAAPAEPVVDAAPVPSPSSESPADAEPAAPAPAEPLQSAEASAPVEAPAAAEPLQPAEAPGQGPVTAEPAARPIWSDDGDAPFDDGEPTPAYADRKARSKSKGKNGKGSGGAMAEFVDIVKTIVYALLIAMVVRILFFQPFTIPSASMEPNLYQGDYIVVSKWSYGYSRHSIPFSPPVFQGRIMASQPERGDIVVFKWPRDNRTDYIKRVIGLPGDRIQMRGGVLHINDAPVEGAVISRGELDNGFYPPDAQRIRETLPGGRTYTTQDFGRGYSDLDDTRVYEVPAGYYFMMGDNRDNSIDSRVDDGVGLVPAENLVGEAQVILFSWREGVSLINPITWFTHARPERFFTDLE